MSRIRWSERSARPAQRGAGDRGFMMVAILIGLGVAAIMMSAALPAWRQQVQRTREEELIFRGEQYARAIVLYQVKNRGVLPQDIDTLVTGKYLRKKWKDPVTGTDFVPVGVGIVALPAAGQAVPVGGLTPTPAGSNQPNVNAGTSGNGQPGVSGVRSRSTATSIKIYQQQQQYNLWAFDATFAAQKMNVNLNALSGNQQGGQQGGRQGGGPGGQPGGARGGQAPAGVGGPGRTGGAGPGATGPGRGGTPPAAPTTGRGRGNQPPS